MDTVLTDNRLGLRLSLLSLGDLSPVRETFTHYSKRQTTPAGRRRSTHRERAHQTNSPHWAREIERDRIQRRKGNERKKEMKIGKAEGTENASGGGFQWARKLLRRRIRRRRRSR